MLHFLDAAGPAVLVGGILFLLGHRDAGTLKQRDGFIIVASAGLGLSFLSALPFILGPHLRIVDALFKAIAGLATTGATVLTDVDDLPSSVLYYRQQLQWLGDAGIIVLAVAVLPLLDIGGMQLFKAETPGPM